MSCSEDISPIYSCAGCCPLLPSPCLLTTNLQHYFGCAQGAAPSVLSSPSSCYFGKTLALLLPSFWEQLQEHTGLCSDGGPTAGSWHSQNYLAWHIPRPSPKLHPEKAYTFLQTLTVSPAAQGSGGKIPWIQEGVFSSDVNSNHTNGKESTSFAWGIKINKWKGCASPVDICYLFSNRAADLKMLFMMETSRDMTPFGGNSLSTVASKVSSKLPRNFHLSMTIFSPLNIKGYYNLIHLYLKKKKKVFED